MAKKITRVFRKLGRALGIKKRAPKRNVAKPQSALEQVRQELKKKTPVDHFGDSYGSQLGRVKPAVMPKPDVMPTPAVMTKPAVTSKPFTSNLPAIMSDLGLPPVPAGYKDWRDYSERRPDKNVFKLAVMPKRN